MAEPRTELKFNGVLLRLDQLVLGMTVAVVLEGNKTVEVDSKGKPYVFRPMIGGVDPMRVSLYTATPEGTLTGDKVSPGRILPNIRFMPIEVFSPSGPQPDREYVVYDNGELLRDSSSRYVARVKPGDGRLLTQVAKSWLREFAVPQSATLIPVTLTPGIPGVTQSRR